MHAGTLGPSGKFESLGGGSTLSSLGCIVYCQDENAPAILAHDRERMKPRSDRAREGRGNPAGISMLYLASSVQTAVSEVRPWVGSEVSVAQFEVSRDVKVIYLSLGHWQSWLQLLFSLGHFGTKPMSREGKGGMD